MSGRIRLLPLLAVGALLAAGAAARVSVGAVTPPTPVVETILGGIACPVPSRCVAVGMSGSRDTVRTPFAIWSADGAWAVRSPSAPSQAGDSLIRSVDCTSVQRCVAVGSHEMPAPYFGARSAGNRPLVEVWDGTTWRPQTAPVPSRTADGQLIAVSCPSSFCMAVGDYAGRSGSDRVLAVVRDGSDWSMRPPPRPRQMEDPTLRDVACTSSTSCVAVGHFTYQVSELFSAAIVPLVLRWDGHGWRFEPSANPGYSIDTELGAISCPMPNRCIAVGIDSRSSGTFSTYAELRDGDTWRMLATPDPEGSPGAEFMDVSCPEPDRCFAVGFFMRGPDPHTLLESWDGSKWTIEPSPTPEGSSASILTAIDCTSSQACEVVGTYRQGTPTQQSFSATLEHGRWSVVRVT